MRYEPLTFGHLRQLEAAFTRWLPSLAQLAPVTVGIDDYAVVDIDDTIKEVHGHHKQGAGFGYSNVRGLNALLGILSTSSCAPITIGARLRKGPTNSAARRRSGSTRSLSCPDYTGPGPQHWQTWLQSRYEGIERVHNAPDGLIVKFAAYTGLHVAELEGLRIGDVNLFARQPFVRVQRQA